MWCQKHGGVKDFLAGSNVHQMELAPEVFLHNKKPDQKSDIWGLGRSTFPISKAWKLILPKGGIILELLFDQKLWNDEELNRNVIDYFAVTIAVAVVVIVIGYLPLLLS